MGTAYSLKQKPLAFVVQQMADTARKYDKGTAEMIEKATAYARNKEKPSVVLEEFQGWAAHEAIAAAVYIYLMEPDSIQRAIFMGVHTPGDSDTIASIAGALVATRNGLSSIPKDWIERVEDSRVILDLADRLVTRDQQVTEPSQGK